ncbi:coiled-coil domain-containing protein 86 [Pygocentrus nattereri]|uniref:Coiled-coil domain-containing protein 86 n=1 Tax=Pygocentrus nattereri TaxID=42514 RepID=A0AAR2JZ90_PYGNA|nr:coiled-coil domain-containing protein 86 [Pygocentrus nattereri]
MPPRKRGGAKAAGNSRKRKGEETPEAQPDTESRQEEPEREDRTPVTGEESTLRVDQMTVTGALNSDHSGEKENQKNTTDTDPGQRSVGAAHAQTCARADRTVPLGKPRSGRVWKDRNKQRFSALLRDKPLRSSWQKKMEAKREKELVKQYHQQLKDQKAREKQEKRKRTEENLKRREENQRKAEIVQVIRNTAKLKRMKKKQLRKIEKRDTLSVLQKTPPAVKKAGKGE